jgi:hypothetical protein
MRTRLEPERLAEHVALRAATGGQGIALEQRLPATVRAALAALAALPV